MLMNEVRYRELLIQLREEQPNIPSMPRALSRTGNRHWGSRYQRAEQADRRASDNEF